MDKEKLKSLTRDKRYISGIYNYCDRWCERCTQTSRCLNYAIGEEEFADPETRDIRNKAYWKKMSEIMQSTLEMVKEMAESAGVDLNELDIDGYEEEERYIKETTENHEVCRIAKEYIDMVNTWMDWEGDLLGEGGGIAIEYEVFSRGENVLEGEALNDAMEVIQWYQHQIYAKLMRAVSGAIEEELNPFDDKDKYARDSDGSAKVALIGIDRSIAAWGVINSRFRRFHNHDIRDIIIHLDQLKRGVEKFFPAARGFIRPGFDPVDLHS